MGRKSKAKFKMKGHTLPGINQRSEATNNKEGRSPSSAFQMAEPGDSPNKFLGLAAMGAGAVEGGAGKSPWINFRPGKRDKEEDEELINEVLNYLLKDAGE